MKIKLSKSQWELIGKKTGWMKKAQEDREDQGDVWTIETAKEREASDDLSAIANKALQGNEISQKFLSDLWDGESWESIKKKLETEGSVYYVWWMDGVREYMFRK